MNLLTLFCKTNGNNISIMRYLLFVLIVTLPGFACHTTTSKIAIPEDEIIQDKQDRMRFDELMEKFSGEKDLPVGELMITIGRSLEGTPYVAHTLEKGIDEKLVVNLREMDCTTFVENCLALSRTIKSGEATYDHFLQELQQIRYRNGIRNEYPSRLHYLSEWLENNAGKSIISLPAREFGNIYPNHVNFMSTHPDSYQCLKAKPGFVPELAKLEKAISAKKYFYIPKEKIALIEDQLKEGDIVGITTNIEGLDVVHTGLLTRVNGRIHLLHASSKAKQVVISDVPLSDYMADKKIQTGIMIGRPG